MTNALTVYERMNELSIAARAMHASGFFGDVKTEAQAMVKVMAGAEIGLPPFASMTGIHIVQGKPVLGANLIATLVKNDPRYDYRVKQSDATTCVLTWYENSRAVGESAFTMTEAQSAGLTGKDNWKKYPSDMLFARALTRGARRYAPGIFGGAPIYTPDEMGVDTDEEGRVIEGQVVTVTHPTPPPATNGHDVPLAYEDGTPVGNRPGTLKAYHAYLDEFTVPPASHEALKEWAAKKKRGEAAQPAAVQTDEPMAAEYVAGGLFAEDPEPVKFVDPA